MSVVMEDLPVEPATVAEAVSGTEVVAVCDSVVAESELGPAEVEDDEDDESVDASEVSEAPLWLVTDLSE